MIKIFDIFNTVSITEYQLQKRFLEHGTNTTNTYILKYEGINMHFLVFHFNFS